MGTGTALAPTPQIEKQQQNVPLLIAGYVLIAFGAFQLSGIFWPMRFIAYLGAPRWVFSLTFAQRVGVGIAAAGISVLFGLYALSGAGTFRRLPLLRTGLALVSLVFLHRFVVMFSNAIRRDPIPVRFVVMSGIVLCIALLYVFGLAKIMRSPTSS